MTVTVLSNILNLCTSYHIIIRILRRNPINLFFSNTSRVDAVLLRGNSRNVNIVLSTFTAPRLIIGRIIRHVGLSMNIIEKKWSQNPRTFVFTVTRTTDTSYRLRHLFLQSPRRNTQWRSYLSSANIIFQNAEHIFTGTQTQDSFFGVVAFVPAISASKQTYFAQAPFFYRA
jgi:hypothetical protein